MSGRAIFAAAVAVCVVVFSWVFYAQLLYTVDASHIAVFQTPFTGKLSVVSVPGTQWRFGASVTEYKKRDLFAFEYEKNDANDHSIQVRFNDGGHAWVGGNLSWEMPVDPAAVIALHTLYGSQEKIDAQLVKTALARAMYLTSPLMSSTESYAARRSEFLQLFADQVENGIYKTETIETKAPDPITGEMKTIRVVTIVKDPKTGEFVRSDVSPLKQFGIGILPPTINNIVYDPEVEVQIKQQRDNIMQIQTAQAQAKKAEQARLTAAASGEAAAMEAKWAQEVIKAREVTQAEQVRAVAEIKATQEKNVAETAATRDKNVAETAATRDLHVRTLAAQTAEQYKVEQTKMGEGEAARRNAVMMADGALTQKIDAWVRSQELWANAFMNFKGSVVPQIVTGGSGQTGVQANAASDFMSLMAMKAAKDLALDTSISLPKR